MARCSPRAPTLPRSAAVGLLALLSGVAACSVPNFEGPQLQDPPQGFLLQPNLEAPHNLFGYLPRVYHDAWVQSLPPFSSIVINGFAGTLTLADALAAQDSLRARPHDPDIRFGQPEPLTVDGRDAWGWEERIDTPQRGIPWVAYRAMVPYDTISYTIEISTEDPLLKAESPATLKAIIFTFGVGEIVWNWPLIALGLGLLFFAIHLSRQRAARRAAQLRSINLVKIKKKETPEAQDAAGVAPAVATAPQWDRPSPE